MSKSTFTRTVLCCVAAVGVGFALTGCSKNSECSDSTCSDKAQCSESSACCKDKAAAGACCKDKAAATPAAAN